MAKQNNNRSKNKGKVPKLPSKKKRIINKSCKIAKSKQLERKYQNRNRSNHVKQQTSNKRVCGNGRPMPSLEELEKMYESSDSEGENSNTVHQEKRSSNITTNNTNIDLEDNLSTIACFDSSENSSDTITYTVNTSSPSRTLSFSPLPSTSRDNDIFIRNEERLNESLSSQAPAIQNQQKNDVRMNENPVETIVLDEEITEFIPYRNTIILVDDASTVNDEEIQVVDIQSKNNGIVTDTCMLSNNEVIDVDEVLSESTPTLDKYRNTATLNTLTSSASVLSQSSNRMNELRSSSTTTSNLDPTKTTDMSCLGNQGANNPDANLSNISSTLTSTVHSPPRMVFSTQNNHELVDIEESSSSSISSLPTIEGLGDTENPNRSNLNSNNCLQSPFSNISNLREKDKLLHSSICRKEPTTITTTTVALTYQKINNVIRKYFNRPSMCIGDSEVRINKILSDLELTYTCCFPHTFGKWLKSLNMVWRHLAIPNNEVTSPRCNNLNCDDSNGINRSDTLPNNTLNEQNNSISKAIGSCPICMETFSRQDIASTICGHLFCFTCIKTAYKSNGRRCPTCRKVLRGIHSFHQIYL